MSRQGAYTENRNVIGKVLCQVFDKDDKTQRGQGTALLGAIGNHTEVREQRFTNTEAKGWECKDIILERSVPKADLFQGQAKKPPIHSINDLFGIKWLEACFNIVPTDVRDEVEWFSWGDPGLPVGNKTQLVSVYNVWKKRGKSESEHFTKDL